MTNLTENINKAMQLIQTEKEYITKQKTNISVAEGRRNDNNKAIEELKQEAVDAGFDPENLDKEIEKLNQIIESKNQELIDIISELESEQQSL